jgi:hypothetical protein
VPSRLLAEFKLISCDPHMFILNEYGSGRFGFIRHGFASLKVLKPTSVSKYDVRMSALIAYPFSSPMMRYKLVLLIIKYLHI